MLGMLLTDDELRIGDTWLLTDGFLSQLTDGGLRIDNA